MTIALRGFGLYPLQQSAVGTIAAEPDQASAKALAVVSSAEVLAVEMAGDGVIQNEASPFGGVNPGSREGMAMRGKFSTRWFVWPAGNNLSGFAEFAALLQGCPLLCNDSTTSLVMTPAYISTPGAGLSTSSAPRVFTQYHVERGGNVTAARDCVARLVSVSGEKGQPVKAEWETFGLPPTDTADAVVATTDTGFDPDLIAFRALSFYETRGITLTLSGLTLPASFDAGTFKFTPGQRAVGMVENIQEAEGYGISHVDNNDATTLEVFIYAQPEDVMGIFAALQADTAVTPSLVLNNGSKSCTFALSEGRMTIAKGEDRDGLKGYACTFVASAVNGAQYTITHAG